MVVFCCVVNCGSRAQRDNVHFFRIPAERHFKHKAEINELSRLRRQKWINAINRKDLTEQKLKYAFVCSKHFTTGKPSVLIDTTHPDWVPTVNMGYGTTKGLASKKLLRYQRKQRRHEVAWEASAPSTSDAVVVGESEQADMQETDAERHFKHKAEINELSRLRRQKWINAINRKDLTEQKLKYAFVCSKHFTTGKPSVLIDTTHPDWVPTVNMGYGTTKGLASKKLLRYQRKQRRHEVAWEASAPSTSDAVVVGESEQADMQETDAKFVQTDLTSEQLTIMAVGLSSSQKICRQLESRIISVDSLRTDSTKLKYYTGLPSNSHFDMVMKLLSPTYQ
nr:unnamed protein product [Callosobruchus analis]